MDESNTTGSITRHAVKGATWLLTGVLYGRVANLLMTIVLARVLTPKDFGLVALATTLLAMLTAVTDLSLSNALIHQQDPTEDDYDTAFTLGAVRGVLLAALMVLGGIVMAQLYGDPRLMAVTAGLATRPLLSGLSSPYYVTYAKNLRFGIVARTEALNYTAQLAVSVAVAFLTRDYWAIVAGGVAASVVNLVSAHWLAPYRPRITFSSWRKIIKFSMWMTLTQSIIIVSNRFDNFMGGALLSLSNFGAYTVGNNVSSMATQSATLPLERVLFPSFARIVSDAPRLRTAFQKAQATLFAAGLPLGVGLALVAEPFVYLSLGPHWVVAITVIRFLAPIFGFQMVFGPVYALAFALGATKALFHRSIIIMVVRVPVIFVGLYFYGLYGLLVARVATGVLESAVNMYMVKSLIGIGPWEQVRVTWRSLLSGIGMTSAVVAVGWVLPTSHEFAFSALSLVCMVVSGAIVYCGLHFSLWIAAGRPALGIETEVVHFVRRLWSRFHARHSVTAE